MQIFRMLHLSDFHFAQDVGLPDLISMMRNKYMGPPADENLAIGVARRAYHRAKEIDLSAILVTGDLATSGVVLDLQRALDFVSSAPTRQWLNKLQQPTLAATGVPIFLLPGNHDRFHNYTAFPGCRNFDSIFRAYWNGGASVKVYPVIELGGERLCILAADFTLRRKSDSRVSAFGIYGQGKAYRDLVDRLAIETKVLRKHYEENIAILWAVHFPTGIEGIAPDTSVRFICCLPTVRPALTVVSGDSGVSTI